MKMPDKPIKITPAKLDQSSRTCFKRAKAYEIAGYEDIADDLDFAGLALRRWATQLRAEKKGGKK